MSLIKKMLSRGKVRSMNRQVSKDPSARNYVALAQEHARLSAYKEVIRVCEEGLSIYPGNVELKRMLSRVGQMEREDRMRELQRQLVMCPRPALWREACELLTESASFVRAEDLASDWFEKTKDGEAKFYMAKARIERFFADRRREDGQMAFQLVEQAREALPDDERVLRCHVQLATRVGIIGDARRSLARLLEIHPGDPELEARFRALLAQGDETHSLEVALRKVETTGQLHDEETSAESVRASGSARPVLQQLEGASHVQAAFYVRGGTALVQGPRGATAERCARSVREIVQSTSNTARKLGLGRAIDVQMEGDFGVLHAVPGDMGSAALWSSKAANKQERALLAELAGNAHTEDVE